MRPSKNEAMYRLTFKRLCDELDITDREERIELRKEIEEEVEEYRSY